MFSWALYLISVVLPLPVVPTTQMCSSRMESGRITGIEVCCSAIISRPKSRPRLELCGADLCRAFQIPAAMLSKILMNFFPFQALCGEPKEARLRHRQEKDHLPSSVVLNRL